MVLAVNVVVAFGAYPIGVYHVLPRGGAGDVNVWALAQTTASNVISNSFLMLIE
jgi:hypothetical protein